MYASTVEKLLVTDPEHVWYILKYNVFPCVGAFVVNEDAVQGNVIALP